MIYISKKKMSNSSYNTTSSTSSFESETEIDSETYSNDEFKLELEPRPEKDDTKSIGKPKKRLSKMEGKIILGMFIVTLMLYWVVLFISFGTIGYIACEIKSSSKTDLKNEILSKIIISEVSGLSFSLKLMNRLFFDVFLFKYTESAI